MNKLPWRCSLSNLHNKLRIIRKSVPDSATNSPCGVWGCRWITCIPYGGHYTICGFKCKLMCNGISKFVMVGVSQVGETTSPLCLEEWLPREDVTTKAILYFPFLHLTEIWSWNEAQHDQTELEWRCLKSSISPTGFSTSYTSQANLPEATRVGRLVCLVGHVLSLNKCNPIQYSWWLGQLRRRCRQCVQ